jgi:hypothetical protein
VREGKGCKGSKGAQDRKIVPRWGAAHCLQPAGAGTRKERERPPPFVPQGKPKVGPTQSGLPVRTQDASLKSLCYGVVRWILTGRVLAFADAEVVFADLYVKRDGLGL